MKTRCTNAKTPQYADYGGRGIRICDRWLRSFDAFLEDMGERPHGTTLDRWPDVNGDYEPKNCRWATRVQQQRNTRRSAMLTHDGQTLTQAEWAERTGIDASTISARVLAGWSAADVLTVVPWTGNRVASKLGEEVEIPQ